METGNHPLIYSVVGSKIKVCSYQQFSSMWLELEYSLIFFLWKSDNLNWKFIDMQIHKKSDFNLKHFISHLWCVKKKLWTFIHDL